MQTTIFFEALNPVTQAFIATLFTWFLTALGAALVFFSRPSTVSYTLRCSDLPS